MRLTFCILLLSSYAVASELIWPTPTGRPTGGSLDDFIQPTISGRTESGLFGMTRNDGSRFHEGIDIQPGWVDANNEPADPVSAVMSGQIAYIERAVRGPYGRYVVIEHPTAELPVYTLYAHLASIDGGIRVGANVVSGQVLGRMGHTSAGVDPISVDRSHLHFEIGLRLSDNFNRWYNQQPEFRGDPNVHGNYNGLNLAGFDPLPVLLRSRSDFHMVVNNLPNALVVVARTSSIPDFVRTYPQLTYGTAKSAAGWRIDFTWHGLPRRWTALMPGDPTIPPSGWRIDRVYENYRDTLEQRKMLEPGRTIPGETLRRTMGVLLGT